MGELETAAAAAAAVLRDAAKEAAHVMSIAAQTAAASGDHDSLIELRADVKSMGIINAENHKVMLNAVGKVDEKVDKQNGRTEKLEVRTGKLEGWRIQVVTIYGAILVAAPFVFYGLTKWFE